jgi:DNA-binding NarL/FixJ family response regulator
MKIVLLNNQNFLVNELNKSEDFKNFYNIKSFDEIYSLNLENESFILLYQLDCDENYIENINSLKNDFENYKLIALRNNPNNIEGCALLKKGFKSYMHTMSNINILESAITAVKNGNTWIYPELMQFLIQSVPLQESEQNKLLETLSVKELEVLELVAQGLNNSQIAQTLSLAEVTIKKHISSLFKKLNVKDRLSLALFFKNNS